MPLTRTYPKRIRRLKLSMRLRTVMVVAPSGLIADTLQKKSTTQVIIIMCLEGCVCHHHQIWEGALPTEVREVTNFSQGLCLIPEGSRNKYLIYSFTEADLR